MQFHIENMTCGGCARGVTRAIYTVDSAANVEADPPTRKVVVTSGQPRAAFEAALDIDPDLTVFVLAATPMEAAARDLKCRFANEIYADRAYNPDATLVDRRQPGAVIHDPDTAAWRMVEMVASGGILTATGHRIATRIDTICLHGDGPQAVAMARAVRTALSEASVRIAAPGAH